MTGNTIPSSTLARFVYNCNRKLTIHQKDIFIKIYPCLYICCYEPKSSGVIIQVKTTNYVKQGRRKFYILAGDKFVSTTVEVNTIYRTLARKTIIKITTLTRHIVKIHQKMLMKF